MPLYPRHIFFGLFLFFLLSRCAQVGQLTGGKRDTTPPKLVNAIPTNANLNFNSDEIVLQFDEFVQLRDLSNQLIVSPKIKTPPEVTAEGKKINIRLKKQELSPNTTYRFSFGNAIVDMHESNPLRDFEYTFSTGSYIDTLRIKGEVTEAFNSKPAGSILIALYNTVAAPTDSLPFNTLPDYISKSNDAGSFSFSYLPYSNYKVYAVLDKNKNLLYDGESEKVAFLSETLNLKSDTNIRLKLFQEEANKTFIKRSSAPYPGFIQVFLNKKSRVEVIPLALSNKSNLLETRMNKEKDTISIYYKNLSDTLGLVVKNLSVNKTDTLLIALPKESALRKKARKYISNISPGKLPLNEKIRFSFLTWMDTARTDLNRIKLSYKKDSTVTWVPVQAHWTDVTTFEIDTKLTYEGSLTLKTDTNTFFDMRGMRYDSATFVFKPETKIEFGKVTLKLLLNKKQSYLVQLINEQEIVVKEKEISFSLSASNSVNVDFTDVSPATYLVKVIYDDNRNKKWDTGNILMKQQPEKAIIHSKQVKVLSDWEIEEEIVIRE